ncbi:hypothetical protein F5146DRAFT_574483 [Armillaria mellea]|nr:hypothetical protein F5146DRAFT_574483 [Armillaria mellea]
MMCLLYDTVTYKHNIQLEFYVATWLTQHLNLNTLERCKLRHFRLALDAVFLQTGLTTFTVLSWTQRMFSILCYVSRYLVQQYFCCSLSHFLVFFTSLLSLACYCKAHLLLALIIPVNDPLSQLLSPHRDTSRFI